MKKYLLIAAALIASVVLLSGCDDSGNKSNNKIRSSEENTPSQQLRDSTPSCLVPSKGGERQDFVFTCSVSTVDASNSSEGYIIVNYSGNNPKVKLQITGPDNNKYTYTLNGGDEVFPLTAGSGIYTVNVYENIAGDQYSIPLTAVFDATITNEFGPYLYPNQYVNFNKDCKTVAKGAELADGAHDDIEVIENVYNFIAENIKYDKQKAENVKSGYVPDVDDTLATKKGICFDYAAVMASMLRSQRIPTRMELGYVDEVYHAWVSTYIEEVGWVNGIIQFDGNTWTMMDPTYAATNGSDETRDFVGDGTDYRTKFVY